MFGLFAQARMITERQYQRLMKTFQENGGNVSDAALRAGVSRETATDYLKDLRGPETVGAQTSENISEH